MNSKHSILPLILTIK